ncbi:hypothetical protein DL769_000770 [Monosporascus sp. CRB-8-3]|nr:hypothetical protein DL769_000770 [Monosporascus sp. CRB-8-3]
MRLSSHSLFGTRPRALRLASLLILLTAATTRTGGVAAQRVSYSTMVVTTCFSVVDDDEPTSSPPPPPQGATVTYAMPPCGACGCPSCTLTSVYTATFALLCPTGLTQKPYTISETYVGMSALPTFAGSVPTSVPYGFTTAVETCGACTAGAGNEGGEPVVATITYPSGGRPYVEGFVPGETAKQDAAGTATAVQGAGGSESDGEGSDAPGSGGQGSEHTPSTLSTAYPSSDSTQAGQHGASSPVVAAGVGRYFAEMGALFIAMVAVAML